MNITIARNMYETLVNQFLVITAETDILDYIEDNHRNKLNVLLNELNSLDYKSLQIADSKLTHYLIIALSNIPICEDTLIVKACCLLPAMIHKQLQSLSVETITKTLEWLLKSIRYHRTIGLCESLRAIQSLCKANATTLPLVSAEKVKTLVILLTGLIENPNHLASKSSAEKYESCMPNDIQLSSVLCLETVLQTATEPDITQCGDILRVVLYQLYANVPSSGGDASEIGTCLTRTAALNICRLVCQRQRSLCTAHIGELLGAGRAFMMHGLPGVSVSIVTKVNVSQQALAEPQMAEPIANKGGKVARQRKSKPNVKPKKPNIPVKPRDPTKSFVETASSPDNLDCAIPFAITSDSDFSESETCRQRQDLQKQTKLRLAALSLIGVLGQVVETKVLFGYWHSMFPTETVAGTLATGLLSCVLRDPSPRCRIAALQATASWLHGSKLFLTRAENSDRPPTSYLPFSLALGDMIVYMYETLTQAVLTESSLPVLTQVLKCLIALIQVTTFKRLKCTFVPQFVKHVRKLVYHKDPTIQVAALMAMEVLISSNEGQPEIMELFGISQRPVTQKLNNSRTLLPDDEELTDPIDLDEWEEEPIPFENTDAVLVQQTGVATAPKISWLLQISLENLGITINRLKTAMPAIAPVRIECLQVVATMSHHFRLLKDHLILISAALEIAFKDTNHEVRFNAIRCFDVLGHSISTFLAEGGTSKVDYPKSCTQFWLDIIPHIMTQLQDDASNAPAKSLCCDSLSNIGVHVFERLPRGQQITLISVLSGASCDEECSIRAAAIRALAVYIMFPSLREDMCYIENTAEAVIRSMASTNLEIRVKGSWALGNITDTLLLNSGDGSLDTVSADLFGRLFETAISCKVNDKVRSNGVRALGNLLRLVNADHLCSDSWLTICMRAIQHLHQFGTMTAGNMKVKWNACYAFGNFMRNKHMFSTQLCSFFDWQALIFPALCGIIVDFPNFKVRINAAAALAVPERREQFGVHFGTVWAALLESLEQSDHIADFNEYMHRDNLVDQLCLAVAHHIVLAGVGDLQMMASQLKRFDSIAAKWLRVLNRMVPERAASLLAAGVQLKSLQTEEMKQDNRAALNEICMCFLPRENL